MAVMSKLRSCDTCGEKTTPSNWARHLKRHHPELVTQWRIKEEQVRCEQCIHDGRGEWFVVRSKIKRHYDRFHQGFVHSGNKRRRLQIPATADDESPAATQEEMVHMYLTATEAMVQESLRQIQDLITVQRFGEKSRLAVEMADYQQEMQRHVPMKPMTLADYHNMLRGEDLAMEYRYGCVICSPADARTILEMGSPRVPIVVPGPALGRSSVTIDQYLAYLSSKPTIDVHTYSQPVDDQGGHLQPRSLTSNEAIRLFRDESAGPVNLLNLDVYRQNEIPACIANLPAYSILRDIREHNTCGKRIQSQPSDLSGCIAFQILGKRGVQSLPHRDHHGVVTTLLCEEGEKCWLMYPEMDAEVLQRWSASNAAAPEPRPFPICLRPGDLLIQPAGRIHAPFSVSDVLITGTMHWDSREMVQVLRMSLYERTNPAVTNEATAMEFSSKLDTIRGLWGQRHESWPWGSGEDFAEFCSLLEVSNSIRGRNPC